MMATLGIALLCFAYVVFRIGNRAYSAYANGYKTWPILAGLAVVYTIVAVVRIFMDMQNLVFLIISFGCIIASQMIYRASANSSY